MLLSQDDTGHVLQSFRTMDRTLKHTHAALMRADQECVCVCVYDSASASHTHTELNHTVNAETAQKQTRSSVFKSDDGDDRPVA